MSSYPNACGLTWARSQRTLASDRCFCAWRTFGAGVIGVTATIFLFITGYAQNAEVGRGHLDARMAVLTKPFAFADFVQKVRGLLDG